MQKMEKDELIPKFLQTPAKMSTLTPKTKTEVVNMCVKCAVQLKHVPSYRNESDAFISVFIMCGKPEDIASIKSKVGQIHEDILFILLDIYK